MTVLRTRLVPLARILTPNLPEAEALAGIDGRDPLALTERLLALGPRAVLLKGGHGVGPTLIDMLAEAGRDPETFEGPRIDTPHTHGTGCTLASALATGLAQGMGVHDAVVRARAYVLEAIRTAPGYGRGHGPLNHAHTVVPFMPST
jgi:hydroxymethylpyrimidine/phosphomethylpyrimidine kinase